MAGTRKNIGDMLKLTGLITGAELMGTNLIELTASVWLEGNAGLPIAEHAKLPAPAAYLRQLLPAARPVVCQRQ